ncbi:hypothetical protein MKD38_06170 [Cupriavidus sp. WGlv3]|uniref:hypothetical protein n=1 Tax=Cupriavidus sp. WGlv3 TaxID=2919924 RepID=UPI00209130D1|nr:hypothetical protein [Cupriavidus sp. WGlv3]MCO4861249.1 hypothetical protein [Cupriavidus sp. WGlv3]
MATVTGQITFVITDVATGEEEYQTLGASEFDIECEAIEREDDKQREHVFMKYRGDAFEGNACFTAVLYYEVFGWNIFEHWVSYENVTSGYKVTIADDEPDDGFSVTAIVDLNED